MPAMNALDRVTVADQVEGRVAGAAFAAEDARFRITRGERRDRVDLLFPDERIERCGLPLPRSHTQVWVRASGRTELEEGELTTEDGAIEVHYERPGEDGVEEIHRGVGRLTIESATSGGIVGELRICFADAEQSCVGGHFRARPCLSRVDGRAIREPPGLSDDALEAVGEAP